MYVVDCLHHHRQLHVELLVVDLRHLMLQQQQKKKTEEKNNFIFIISNENENK